MENSCKCVRCFLYKKQTYIRHTTTCRHTVTNWSPIIVKYLQLQMKPLAVISTDNSRQKQHWQNGIKIIKIDNFLVVLNVSLHQKVLMFPFGFLELPDFLTFLKNILLVTHLLFTWLLYFGHRQIIYSNRYDLWKLDIIEMLRTQYHIT